MLKKFINGIAFLLEEKQIIEKEDLEVCSYGMELLLNNFITVLFLMVAGAMMGATKLTIVFTVIFISIKRYTGGFHCNTYGKCLMLTILIHLSVIAPAILLPNSVKQVMGITFLIYSGIKIYSTDPIISAARPKTFKEVERCKEVKNKMVIIILLVEVSLLVFVQDKSMFYVIASSLLAIAINISISEKEEVSYYERYRE